VADTPHRKFTQRRTSSIIKDNTNNWNLTDRWLSWTFASSDLLISFLEPPARLSCDDNNSWCGFLGVCKFNRE